MNKDTRTEFLVLLGVLLFLGFLWLRNRPTQGSGLSATILPSSGRPTTNAGVPLALTMPTSLTAGDVFPSLTPANIDVGSTLFNFASSGGCGCSPNQTGGPTYGSASDMAAGLLAGGYDMPFVSPDGAY